MQGGSEPVVEVIVWSDAVRDGLGLSEENVAGDFVDHGVLLSMAGRLSEKVSGK